MWQRDHLGQNQSTLRQASKECLCVEVASEVGVQEGVASESLVLSLLLYGSTFWNVGSFTPRHREFLVATDTRHHESDHTVTCELGGSVRAIRHWYLPALVPPAAAVEAAAGDTPAPGVLLLLYSCCGGRRHLVYYSCSGGRRHAGIWCVTLVAAAGGTWCITRSNKTTGISATAAALFRQLAGMAPIILCRDS